MYDFNKLKPLVCKLILYIALLYKAIDNRINVITPLSSMMSASPQACPSFYRDGLQDASLLIEHRESEEAGRKRCDALVVLTSDMTSSFVVKPSGVCNSASCLPAHLTSAFFFEFSFLFISENLNNKSLKGYKRFKNSDLHLLGFWPSTI